MSRNSNEVRNHESTAARKVYSRCDGVPLPDDISLEHLEELKTGFYETKVVATPEGGCYPRRWLLPQKVVATPEGGCYPRRSQVDRKTDT